MVEVPKKPETFYERKLKEYKEEACKQFGSSSLDWKPRLSKLDQAKLEAINTPRIN